MRRVRWAATVALLPVVALTACDESATSPANESHIPPANAQAIPPDIDAPELPGPRGPGEILALADELGLSGTQRAAVQEIAEALQRQNEPLWEQLRGSGPPRGGPGSGGPPSGGPPSGGPPSMNPGPLGSTANPAIQKIRANTRAAMQEALSHLTEAQVQLFRELRSGRLDRPGIDGGGPGTRSNPGAALQRLLGELPLTVDQRSRVDAVLAEIQERNQALRTELRARAASARGPGVAPGWDPEDPRVRELRENLRTGMAAIREILTEAQWTQFEALLRERRGQPPGPGSE